MEDLANEGDGENKKQKLSCEEKAIMARHDFEALN
jgi:hypothetical protein